MPGGRGGCSTGDKLAVKRISWARRLKRVSTCTNQTGEIEPRLGDSYFIESTDMAFETPILSLFGVGTKPWVFPEIRVQAFEVHYPRMLVLPIFPVTRVLLFSSENSLFS